MNYDEARDTFATKMAAICLFVERCAKPIKYVAIALIMIACCYGCCKVLAYGIEKDTEIKATWSGRAMQYVEFDGHEYVLLKGGRDVSSGITHSPKCKCLRKEEIEDIQ